MKIFVNNNLTYIYTYWTFDDDGVADLPLSVSLYRMLVSYITYNTYGR